MTPSEAFVETLHPGSFELFLGEFRRDRCQLVCG